MATINEIGHKFKSGFLTVISYSTGIVGGATLAYYGQLVLGNLLEALGNETGEWHADVGKDVGVVLGVALGGVIGFFGAKKGVEAITNTSVEREELEQLRALVQANAGSLSRIEAGLATVNTRVNGLGDRLTAVWELPKNDGAKKRENVSSVRVLPIKDILKKKPGEDGAQVKLTEQTPLLDPSA